MRKRRLVGNERKSLEFKQDEFFGRHKYTMLSHRQPVDTLGQSIEKPYYWPPTSGRELRSEPLLLYRNVMEKPAPQDNLISLCLPLVVDHRLV